MNYSNSIEKIANVLKVLKNYPSLQENNQKKFLVSEKQSASIHLFHK